MQAARADVFGLLVDRKSEARDGVNGVLCELDIDPLSRQQRFILARQRILWLGEDALEVFDGQRLQLDTNREAALQFRYQIGRLRGMKRARGDKQNVIGAHRPILGVDGRAFDNREQIALDAFARDVGATARFASGNLVDLIEEDNA